MYWSKLQTLSESHFQRYTGIKLPTFQKMVEVVKKHELATKNHRSRPPKFMVEDRILIMLCYYREYPTYFHLAQKYGIHESTSFRIVIAMENILIKSGIFALPKKSSIASDTTLEVIVVDASESPIQRPKKSKYQKLSYSGKKNTILKNSNC